MKIRTDFVTNSSGSNTVEIIIDNPFLLDILQKYKETGLFTENSDAFYGYDIYIGSSSLHSYLNLEEYTRTPAISISINDEFLGGYNIPVSLEDVLDVLIEILDYEWINKIFDKFVYSKLREELLQRKEEVIKGFLKVGWHNTSLNDADAHSYEEFTYDPLTGEIYSKDTDYFDSDCYDD